MENHKDQKREKKKRNARIQMPKKIVFNNRNFSLILNAYACPKH